MKILADEHIPYIKEYFDDCGTLVLEPGRVISAHDLVDTDMLIVRSVTHVDEKLLKNSHVKFVGSVTAGADHLDTQWLDETHITWRVANGFNAPPVADYVICVMAALQRKQILGKKNLKAAVIGVGNVGKLVVQRLQTLNVDVIQCDPVRAAQEADFISHSLDEISDVDLISLHVPLTKKGEHPTYHFINQDFLRRQKPGCVLINASRGGVIHSKDLLSFGKHLYWCLDVWEHEPNIDKAILERAMIATPHIAGYSVQSKMRGIAMIYHTACQLGIISPKAIAPNLPHQDLSFSEGHHAWQDIVLGIFNPLILTAMMRSTLFEAENHGEIFDKLRHDFNYRYEFAYSNIKGVDLKAEDQRILTAFNINHSHP